MGIEKMSEPEIVVSKLSARVTSDDKTVTIEIYRLESDSAWTLEVVDEGGGSTVWDDKFPTEQAAFKEATDAIEKEGIESFIVESTINPTIH